MRKLSKIWKLMYKIPLNGNLIQPYFQTIIIYNFF